MWDLPGPGLEPMSPALASGFLTTAPPGESQHCNSFSSHPYSLLQNLLWELAPKLLLSRGQTFMCLYILVTNDWMTGRPLLKVGQIRFSVPELCNCGTEILVSLSWVVVLMVCTSILITLIQHSARNSNQYNKAGKKVKGIQIRKEEVKPSLYAEDMII